MVKFHIVEILCYYLLLSFIEDLFGNVLLEPGVMENLACRVPGMNISAYHVSN
jgi:hypothetical protein